MKVRINIFKERLKQLREQKGFTLSELGAKIGVTRQAIIKFENDKAFPSFWILCDLAEALSVSVSYLVGQTDDPKVRKPRKKD